MCVFISPRGSLSLTRPLYMSAESNKRKATNNLQNFARIVRQCLGEKNVVTHQETISKEPVDVVNICKDLIERVVPTYIEESCSGINKDATEHWKSGCEQRKLIEKLNNGSMNIAQFNLEVSALISSSKDFGDHAVFILKEFQAEFDKKLLVNLCLPHIDRLLIQVGDRIEYRHKPMDRPSQAVVYAYLVDNGGDSSNVTYNLVLDEGTNLEQLVVTDSPDDNACEVRIVEKNIQSLGSLPVYESFKKIQCSLIDIPPSGIENSSYVGRKVGGFDDTALASVNHIVPLTNGLPYKNGNNNIDKALSKRIITEMKEQSPLDPTYMNNDNHLLLRLFFWSEHVDVSKEKMDVVIAKADLLLAKLEEMKQDKVWLHLRLAEKGYWTKDVQSKLVESGLDMDEYSNEGQYGKSKEVLSVAQHQVLACLLILYRLMFRGKKNGTKISFFDAICINKLINKNETAWEMIVDAITEMSKKDDEIRPYNEFIREKWKPLGVELAHLQFTCELGRETFKALALNLKGLKLTDDDVLVDYTRCINGIRAALYKSFFPSAYFNMNIHRSLDAIIKTFSSNLSKTLYIIANKFVEARRKYNLGPDTCILRDGNSPSGLFEHHELKEEMMKPKVPKEGKKEKDDAKKETKLQQCVCPICFHKI